MWRHPTYRRLRCPASRHQCKYCHKLEHISHLCFKKKQEVTCKRSSRNPKAHHLMVGTYSIEGPIDTSFTSSEDSLCLQMKVKHKQAEDNCSDVQHLVTNLEYKLKSHRRRTKFLRATIDTCSSVNVMPVSVYHVMYKDADCAKLAPSKKNGIYTYTTEKIPVIGSCELFVLHPDIKCFKEVTFQVVNTEGSVIVSCVTSISLNLIQIHSELNASIPECGNLIYSCADNPEKYKHNKPKSREVAQWKNKVVQEKYKKQRCQAQDNTVCSGKKSQETKLMQPKKPNSYMQSKEPAIKYKKKNQVSIEEDQKGQVPICIEKNSQEKKYMNMWH